MISKKSETPDNQELRRLAEKLINEQNTMTLASAQENVAWTAPVYYVFYKSCFYFFSESNSRHIVESMQSGQAASAIYGHASTWQEIRGIQMSGSIEMVSAGLSSINAIKEYLKKFPFTKEFFIPGQKLDLAAFADRFKVRLYRFKPGLIYYMDNSIRFGFRETVILK
jgi:uncharacterized protein YhbP (UPF0306 family)